MNRAESAAGARQAYEVQAALRLEAFRAGGWDRVPVTQAMKHFGVSRRTICRWRAQLYADAKTRAGTGRTSLTPGPLPG